MVITNEEKNALENFIKDIDCLSELSEWINKPNIFKILKLARTEIRHSNMLAWLLTPNESHNLGEYVLKNFTKFAISENSQINLVEAETMDYSNFIILREWNNIDILAFSETNKVVLCVENKIDSGEHGNQLNKYKKIIDEKYKEYKKLFIYLTLYGDHPSDIEWEHMTHADICNILIKALKLFKIDENVEILIKNYIDILKELTMGNIELQKICDKIYSKHKQAIDLIIEHKTDDRSTIAEFCKNWVKKKFSEGLLLDENRCSKSFIRFTSNSLDNLLPNSDKISEWGTKNHYFYEIELPQDISAIKFRLEFSGGNAPDDLLQKMNLIAKNINGKVKDKWKWLAIDQQKIQIDTALDKEAIFSKLDNAWTKLKSTEDKILNIFNN